MAYKALEVPEIWRYDGNRSEIYALQGDEYIAQSNSLALPLLTAADISQFLTSHQTMGENALVKQFRQWIRQ